MDRPSRVALWTLASAALTAAGCADILGFQDFSSGDGGASSGSTVYTGGAGTTQSPGTTNSDSTATNGPGTDPGPTSGDSGPASGGTGLGSSGSSGPASVAGSSSPGAVGGSSSATGGSSSGPGSAASSSTSGTGSSGAGSKTGGSSSSSLTGGSSSSSSLTGGSSSSSSQGPAGPCTFGDSYNGSGSFTYYYFGQGTCQNGTCKTACGYTGTETGSGQSAVDTVPNAAGVSPAKDSYFAAIPGSNGFNTVTDCGACIEITNGGTKIVATIIDECPTDNGENPACKQAGHLDLSTQAFDAMGYSVGDPSGTTWKFVACPVSGNIKAVENSAGQYYLQNAVYPITTANGQMPTQYGYFTVNPGSVTVTSSAVNQSVTITIPNGGGDTGGNFTEPTGCY
jgi:hypothetical protein